MPKRVLEARTPAARAQQRQTLGTLRELTVQPATKMRYNKAVDGFLLYLRENHLELPTKRDKVDPLICDYIEHLWSSGQGRGLANDTLAGLQDADPKLKHQLPGAWRLLKTWHVNEVPNRAPPLPVVVLHAMCGWAWFHGHHGFAVSLLMGFYGMLRTGEILGIRRQDLKADVNHAKILLSRGLTKSGKRMGAAESVILGYDKVVVPLLQWMKLAGSTSPLTYHPGKWRLLFNEALKALHLTDFEFRPYSLRRGGATWWFSRHHSLDKLLVDGRWSAAKTARIYLNEGLSVLAQLKISASNKHISPFLRLFESKVVTASFATLEPPNPSVGRSGGRGKRSKTRNNFLKSMKNGNLLRVVGPLFGMRGTGLSFVWVPPKLFPAFGVWPEVVKSFSEKNRGFFHFNFSFK